MSVISCAGVVGGICNPLVNFGVSRSYGFFFSLLVEKNNNNKRKERKKENKNNRVPPASLLGPLTQQESTSTSHLCNIYRISFPAWIFFWLISSLLDYIYTI